MFDFAVFKQLHSVGFLSPLSLSSVVCGANLSCTVSTFKITQTKFFLKIMIFKIYKGI